MPIKANRLLWITNAVTCCGNVASSRTGKRVRINFYNWPATVATCIRIHDVDLNISAPLGKRGWKLLFCTLRDFALYLHKDDQEYSKSQLTDNAHNAIRLHHALATKATDYTKKEHVFRLQTADRAEYLFRARYWDVGRIRIMSIAGLIEDIGRFFYHLFFFFVFVSQ